MVCQRVKDAKAGEAGIRPFDVNNLQVKGTTNLKGTNPQAQRLAAADRCKPARCCSPTGRSSREAIGRGARQGPERPGGTAARARGCPRSRAGRSDPPPAPSARRTLGRPARARPGAGRTPARHEKMTPHASTSRGCVMGIHSRVSMTLTRTLLAPSGAARRARAWRRHGLFGEKNEGASCGPATPVAVGAARSMRVKACRKSTVRHPLASGPSAVSVAY